MKKNKKIFEPALEGAYGGVSASEVRELHAKLQKEERTITAIFLDAVNRHDGEQIMALARAVWFFKDKRHNNFADVDNERKQLLFLKTVTDEIGEKLTIRDVALALGFENLTEEKKRDMAADGFSALRRKCKQLGIVLVPSRKIRRR